MNYSIKKTLQIGILLLWLPLLTQGQSSDTLRVLFVGNSYTYFWNLPQTFSAMAASQGKQIIARQSTAGGVTLKQHWEGDKELQTRKLISEGDWDVVVLQNHSLSSLNNRDDFMEYGKRFIELVKASGATPLLYVTWARAANPLMQEDITEAYEVLARESGVETVPVGQIWDRVRALRSDLILFDQDGTHPSPAGTYLNACIFYVKLTGKSSALIPARVTTNDKDGEKLYLAIMPEGDADFIQQVVDEYLNVGETEKR